MKKLLIIFLMVACVAIFIAVTWPAQAQAANTCNLSGADRLELRRYGRFSEGTKTRYADTTDAAIMALPTTWEDDDPAYDVLNDYYYHSRRYAFAIYWQGGTMLHYIDIKQSTITDALYIIILPADLGGHGCLVFADPLDGGVEAWLDSIVQ